VIVFIDESYQQDSTGKWYYALAGFGIDEFRYRALQAAIYQLVRTYFDHRSSYEGDSWRAVLTEKIIVEQPHDEIELKAQYLLKRSNLERFGGTNAPHHKLVRDAFRLLEQTRGTTLGVILSPDDPKEVKQVDTGCPYPFQKLIGVIANWMDEQFPGRPVTLALDTEHDGINLPLSRSIADFLYRTRSGQEMKHVFPSPFWIDSQSMAGSQIADLVAHVLMSSMLPEAERKPIEELWGMAFRLSHKWRGRENGSTIYRIR